VAGNTQHPRRARQEAAEQLQNIRNSALRGLVGGTIGFVLVDQLLFTAPLSDVSFEIFSIFLTASFGALAGLLMTFLVDISIASYGGSKKPLAYLAGGIGGALSFALAMVMYANLNNTGGEFFLSLIPKPFLKVVCGGQQLGQEPPGRFPPAALCGSLSRWLFSCVGLCSALRIFSSAFLGNQRDWTPHR